MVLSARNPVSEKQIRFLAFLIMFVMMGYISLAFAFLFGWSNLDLFANPVQTTFEFMPVMIIAMCSFFIVFTCGEFFGLLRYQFSPSAKEPASRGLALISLRMLSVFFLIFVCFYYLRIGFNESLLEKLFLTGLPLLMGIYMIMISGRLYRSHFMPYWYFRQKRILLIFCVFSQFLANTILFFPEILVKIPLLN